MSNPLIDNHLSGMVTRYAARPPVNLLNQSTGQHSHGMLMLLYKMHPNPGSELVKAITLHDADELLGGDLPYPFKQAFPVFAKEHEAKSQELARARGITAMPALSDTDRAWLKMLDRLEAWMFVRVHRPEVLKQPDWTAMAAGIVKTASELGCYVSSRLNEVISTQGVRLQ